MVNVWPNPLDTVYSIRTWTEGSVEIGRISRDDVLCLTFGLIRAGTPYTTGRISRDDVLCLTFGLIRRTPYTKYGARTCRGEWVKKGGQISRGDIHSNVWLNLLDTVYQIRYPYGEKRKCVHPGLIKI